MNSSEDYDIIDSGEHKEADSNGIETKGNVDFGAQLRKTQKKQRNIIRHPVESPDYLGQLKKSEKSIDIRGEETQPDGKPVRKANEENRRMTADELIKIANSAMTNVDEKEKRDMAARRGVTSTKVASAGTTFKGFQPSDDPEKIDFKSVLRRSMRKEQPASSPKKEDEKPEWMQQKRNVNVSNIENKIGKSKQVGESPEWADKVQKITARQKVSELEHRKTATHQPNGAPEWAARVPKDSNDVLAKAAQRPKERGSSDGKPNYRGVLKSTNISSDRRE